MITLTDTYRHLDGTPGTGRVLVRTATPFHDGQGTVLGDWVAYPLGPDGSVSIVIDADLEHANPGPQWLQVLEDVDCRHGTAWDIGPDVLFATPDPTIVLGEVRQVPALGAQPRYVAVPGPPGDPGPVGPKGDPGPVAFADLMGMTPVDWTTGQAWTDGDIVRFNGALWVAKRDQAAGDSPATKPGSWQVLELEAVALKASHTQALLRSVLDAAAASDDYPAFKAALAAL